MQDSTIEQVLSRVEDAVLILQGTPYLLAETGGLLHARRHRLPPSARVSPPCIVWAAWYSTRLLVKSTPKGVVFFLVFSHHALHSSCQVPCFASCILQSLQHVMQTECRRH